MIADEKAARQKRGCRKCIIKCVSGSSLIPVCTGIGIQNKKSLCWRQYQERQKSGSQNSLFSFVFCSVVPLKQLSAGTNPARNVRFFACFSAFPRWMRMPTGKTASLYAVFLGPETFWNCSPASISRTRLPPVWIGSSEEEHLHRSEYSQEIPFGFPQTVA